MPPKFKFTKQEITDAALDIVRCSGADGMTARAIATRLGTSPKVIFGSFHNMDELQKAVIASAGELYRKYTEREISDQKYPSYKASGMAYIRFAKEERELFKILFMRDRAGETLPDGFAEAESIISIITSDYGFSKPSAERFHLEMWIFVHGIAAMTATGYLLLDEDSVSALLTHAFEGLKQKFGSDEARSHGSN